MKSSLIFSFIFWLVFCFLISCSDSKQSDVVIVTSSNASPVQLLASKEINRYIYLRTSLLSRMCKLDSIPDGTKNIIFIGNYIQLSKSKEFSTLFTSKEGSNLKEQGYIIKEISKDHKNYLAVIGGDDFGCLYGAYRLAELMGVRFYLHGDVVPDVQEAFTMPPADIHANPLFSLRGILPFHDFPEGPDWWNLDEYKSILSQLPKMGMNFFGLHTYPEGRPNAEPTVWIGLKSEIDSGGSVLHSYPSSYQNTRRGNWGYAPESTSDYHFGANLLFESNEYSGAVMAGMLPAPTSDSASNELFNNTGTMLRNAFTFAHELGIKTCVGTETPLIVPKQVGIRLKKQRLDVQDPKIVSQLYEGIFERIKRSYPVDYYWLWTPESWTWDSVSANTVKKTGEDLSIAIKSSVNIKATFTLATCGWVLGPPNDRKQFDRILPKKMPFSCINRYVGFSLVEKEFSGIGDRPKWAIPWMEDDPALTYPQLWAGRMRRDAMDALKYGCNGLLGIHWRTEIIGPNVSALAKAAWNQANWQSIKLPDSVRDLPVKDFYEDWAKSQFGEEVSMYLAALFSALDGSPLFKPESKQDYQSNLYRPVSWIDGPGGIKSNIEDWEILKKKFAFIDEFESVGQYLKGPGNRVRYDYWLNYFRYARDITHLGCVLGALDSLMHQNSQANLTLSLSKDRIDKAISLRSEAAALWEKIETSLLSSVATSGEIGTITNLEQHNLLQLKLLTRWDSLLVAVSGKPLPANCDLKHEYEGPERIFLPVARGLYENNENIKLRIIILSKNKATKATLYWRKIGVGQYNQVEIKNVANAVYTAEIKASEIKGADIEYYLTAEMPSSKTLVYPPTAPEINSTIIILPAKPN